MRSSLRPCFAILLTFASFQLGPAFAAYGAAAPGKVILGYASPGARALPFWIAQDLGLFATWLKP